jgi:P-type Cu+ transporter
MFQKVSLGVSVAYFSSVAELAISASRDPNDGAVSAQSTTYFDSVVFLTMFLLIGIWNLCSFLL